MAHADDVFGSVPEMVRRHEKDLYHGNGKPGICTRMEKAEVKMEDHDGRMDGLDSKLNAIILLLITTLAGVAVNLFKH